MSNRAMRDSNESSAQRVLAMLNGNEYIASSLGVIFTEPSPSDPIQNLERYQCARDFISKSRYHPRTRFHHINMLIMVWISKRYPDVFDSNLRSSLHSDGRQIFGRIWDTIGDKPSVLSIEKVGDQEIRMDMVCGENVFDDFKGGEIIIRTKVHNPSILSLLIQHLFFKMGGHKDVLPIVGDVQLLKQKKLKSSPGLLPIPKKLLVL